MGLLKKQSTLTIAVWASVLIHTAGFLGFELAFSHKRESFPKFEPRTVTIVSINSVSSSVSPQDINISNSVQNEDLEENPVEKIIQENKVLPEVLKNETVSLEKISNNITTSEQEDVIPFSTRPVSSGQEVIAEEAILVTEPIPLNSIEPKYPFIARKKGFEGVVVIDVLVSNSGKPLSCQITDSSGYKDLDNAAKKSVLSSLFQPGTLNGEEIESTLRISISFLFNKS